MSRPGPTTALARRLEREYAKLAATRDQLSEIQEEAGGEKDKCDDALSALRQCIDLLNEEV